MSITDFNFILEYNLHLMCSGRNNYLLIFIIWFFSWIRHLTIQMTVAMFVPAVVWPSMNNYHVRLFFYIVNFVI